jgi:REP element-mobilizing transposase RayT
MINSHNKVYLFVHVIWSVVNRERLLTKPIRNILFSHIKQNAEEKGVNVMIANGVEDHMHCLLKLHPTQNLAQVIKLIKGESSHWLNETKLLQQEFEWQDGYAAYSVSPSAVKQVMDYIYKQEEHHKIRTLETELEVLDKIQI